MTPHVAVAHYPEGAGHATRMMAIARALEERGASVTMAGGGFGRRFYEPNGYAAVTEMPAVDYVRDFQGAGGPLWGLIRVLKNSLPDSVMRIRELVGWLRREAPDAAVTDDMFAAVAAARAGIPLYVLTHNSAGLYRDPIVRVTTRALTVGQDFVAKRFFYPAVWPAHDSDPEGVTRTPPVALRQASDQAYTGPEDPGVVLIPSTYSTGFDDLADRVRDAGHSVTHVGREDWDPVPAMLPVLERAEAVVCAGYSTIMEAAVAGTPCIVWPSTNEQIGVAKRLANLRGFSVVDRPDNVLAALADLPAPPVHDNGDGVVADQIVADLA